VLSKEEYCNGRVKSGERVNGGKTVNSGKTGKD
jgi:hypothetical protein